MKTYSVGYAFSRDGGDVLLIRKTRPAAAAGKWLPIGGHVEDGEHPNAAQRREFAEETGIAEPVEWERYITVRGAGWTMHCFRAYTNLIYQARTVTDEEVRVFGFMRALGMTDMGAGPRDGGPEVLFHDAGWLMMLARDHETQADKIVLASEAW